MIPNMYKIAGELLPGVIHVSARALSNSSIINIWRSSRCYGSKTNRICNVAAGSVQEVMDLAASMHT